MTSTGGPEHFLADPASSSESATDPIVLGNEHAPLPGDDIVVEPHGTASHPRRRHREVIVGVVAVVLIGAGVAVALANRHKSGGNTQVTSAAAAHPPAGHPSAAHPSAVKPTHVKPRNVESGLTTPNTAAHVSIAPTTPVVVPAAPPVSAQSAPTPPPTAPPVTMPPSEPPSVLRWNASPSTLSLAAGAHAVLTVTVVNATAGTVTLPHPISCLPTLAPLHGPALGGMVCAEMTQLVGPHAKVVQHYTIYATDTGDASGTPLAAGQYLANIENLHNVKVTITKN